MTTTCSLQVLLESLDYISLHNVPVWVWYREHLILGVSGGCLLCWIYYVRYGSGSKLTSQHRSVTTVHFCISSRVWNYRVTVRSEGVVATRRIRNIVAYLILNILHVVLTWRMSCSFWPFVLHENKGLVKHTTLLVFTITGEVCGIWLKFIERIRLRGMEFLNDSL